MNLIQVLKRCEVFVGLSDDDLQKIADLPSWMENTYEVGHFIFHEDDIANNFYILEEGEISLLVALNENDLKGVKQTPVDTITKGDVFGWSSLVSPHSLTMSATCIKPSKVLVVDGAELSQLFDRDTSLGYEVMKGLVRVIGARLRDIRRAFARKDNLPFLKSRNGVE